jgi:hypothetical protein
VPPDPLAVSVKVVVLAGVTVLCPEGATLPMPLSMLTESALVLDQLKVALAPRVMLEGVAVSVAVGAGGDPETPEHPKALRSAHAISE